jgi:hypothetical protein
VSARSTWVAPSFPHRDAWHPTRLHLGVFDGGTRGHGFPWTREIFKLHLQLHKTTGGTDIVLRCFAWSYDYATLRHASLHTCIACSIHHARPTSTTHLSQAPPLHTAPTAYPGVGIFPPTERPPRRDRACGPAGSRADLIHTVRLHLPLIQTPHSLLSLLAFVRARYIAQARYNGPFEVFRQGFPAVFLFIRSPSSTHCSVIQPSQSAGCCVHLAHCLTYLVPSTSAD